MTSEQIKRRKCHCEPDRAWQSQHLVEFPINVEIATVASLLRNDSKKELEIAKIENGSATKEALLGAASNRGL